MRRNMILICLCLLLIAPFSRQAAAAPQLDNMEPVAENEYLVLYMNPETTEIAVYNKASRDVWYSNPPDWETQETTARGAAKEQLGSQVILTYDRSDRRNREMNNYSASITEGLFEIIPIENGVRIEYSLGRAWSDDDYLPLMIEQGRFEELILNQVPSREAREFSQRYNLVYLRDWTGGARAEVRGMDMDRLLGEYEFVVVDDRSERWEEQLADLRAKLAEASADEKENLESQITRVESQLNNHRGQILRDMLDMIAANVNDVENVMGLTLDHLRQLVDTPTYVLGRVPVFARGNLIEAIKEHTNYRPEDANEDRVANNLDPIQRNIETFFVPIEYTLDGTDLVVRVPVDEVVYPLDVVDNQGQSHTYPLHTITVLPYFGAAYKDAQGYIFMPDGSGALVNFDTPKYTLSYLSHPVYGNDLTADSSDQLLIYPEQTYLPVYGMKVGQSAFLAIIEDGEALARLNVAKAGFVNSYHFVHPRFNVMPSTSLSLGPIGEVRAYQKRIYQGDIKLRYRFLSGSAANYVGMAKAYQQYLVENYGLKKTDASEDLPFFLSIVGNIVRDEPVIGVPREVVRSLTSFGQTAEIVQQLLDQDVNNIKLRYGGWLKGGPEHIFPTKVQFEKSVGGEEGFRKLQQFLADRGIEFYPQVGFQIVYQDKWLDGFRARRDAAKFFDNRPKRLRVYDLAFGLGAYADPYILSPSSLEKVISSFMESAAEYGIKRLALDDLGKYVNSSFEGKAEQVIDRQQGAALAEAELARLKDGGFELLADGGNAFVLPYVRGVVNIPTGSSNHEILDETVPFYQLVLQGCVDYAGEPLNLAADYRRELLQTIVFGGGLHFQWAYENTELLSNTHYNHWYAVRFQDWLERAVRDYALANEIAQHVRGASITNHVQIGDNWYLTVYDNGCSISVNYDTYTLVLHSLTGPPVFYQF